MSVTSGFFNSINSDRLYDATQMSQIFDGIIHDGVYETYGDHFAVRPGTSGLSVLVGTGRAWFHHTWTLNDEDLLLYLDAAATNLPRCDAVVLKVDTTSSVRENSIEILTGTPASTPAKPTYTNTQYVHYYPLAYITIPARATEVLASEIENWVGKAPTYFVTGPLDYIDSTALISQWWAQWQEYVTAKGESAEAWEEQFESDLSDWKSVVQGDLTDWISEQESEYNTWVSGFESDAASWWSTQQAWMSTHQAEFISWFENLQYVLDGDVAGHLQNEIEEHVGSLVYSANGVHGLRYDTTEKKLLAEDANGVEHDVGGASWLTIVNGKPSITFTTGGGSS